MAVKPARIRFYFDEDVLGLAKTITRLRTDCTFPGDSGDVIHKRERPPCPISRGTKDTVWVPTVTDLGWLIISRDYRIRQNPAERAAVRDAGARMVALSGEDAKTVWGQLELFMKHWRRLEGLLEQEGPYIWLASRSGMRQIDLSP